MVRYGTGSDQSTSTRPFSLSISLLSCAVPRDIYLRPDRGPWGWGYRGWWHKPESNLRASTDVSVLLQVRWKGNLASKEAALRRARCQICVTNKTRLDEGLKSRPVLVSHRVSSACCLYCAKIRKHHTNAIHDHYRQTISLH